MSSFQEALAEACGACSPHDVRPESMSDLVEAVWSAPDVPSAVQEWLRDVGRATRERNGRRERRHASRNIPLPQEKEDRRALDPAAVAEAMDLAAAISQDSFDAQVMASCLGEHPLYEDFGEFAAGQDDYSQAHAYKRREQVRQRLRSLLSA